MKSLIPKLVGALINLIGFFSSAYASKLALQLFSKPRGGQLTPNGKLFLDNTTMDLAVTCVDPNKGMISKGKSKLEKYKNINWIISPAEKLPVLDNTYDFYTIFFFVK